MKFVRISALGGMIIFALLGCSGAGGATPSPPPPVASQVGGEGAGPGWLAYVGPDGNVYLTTPDRQQKVAITDDATTALEGEGRSYHRLSWSPQGELAFAAVERSGNRARGQIYTVTVPDGDPQLVVENDENFIIYIYWSPAPCEPMGECRRLAYLVNEGQDIGLHFLDVDPAGIQDRLVTEGRPVYFSWSPSGEDILLHTGGHLPSDSPAKVSLYGIERDFLQELPIEVGDFQSPAWFPGGGGWLGVNRQGGADRLTSYRNSNPDEHIPASPAVVEAREEIVFSLSPGGDRIAYAVRGRGRAPYYGPVHAYDLETGESRQITPEGLPTLGFFWSPGGERLGYLTRLILDENLWMQWRVADLEEEQDNGYEVFRPSPSMEFIVQSFTQYEHSHRFWSPDGRYLVYADRVPGPVDRVWLIDTWAENDEEPLLVGEGSYGVWSWK